MIRVEGISHNYPKSEEKALKEISFSINKGDFWGLIGPNGAGKTTLLSTLSGIIKPTEGTVFYNDQIFAENRREILKTIGVVPQEYSLYPMLTPVENLMFFGAIYGESKKALKEKIKIGLERVEMSEHAHKKISQLSGGMKRRINLLAGIIHEPSILFLDEPTVGVDVQSKDILVNYIKNLNQNGTTIIYTSHHLQEAQDLCSHIGFINKGQLVSNLPTPDYFKQFPEAKSIEDIYHKINS